MAAVITDNDIRAAAEEFAAVMNAYDASPADGSVLSERHIQAMAKLFARSGSRRRSRRIMRAVAACFLGFLVFFGGAFAAFPEVRAAVRRIVPQIGARGSIYEDMEITEQLSFSSVQEAVDRYVDYLRNQTSRSLAVSGNYIYCFSPGLDPGSSLAQQNTEIQDDLRGLMRFCEKHRAENYAKIAAAQYEFILEQFGMDAWDNVSYYVEECGDEVVCREYYIVKTGEKIDRARYDTMLLEFWNDVAKKEGVGFEELWQDGKYSSAAEKHLSEVPVKAVNSADQKALRIYLLFNGAAEGKECSGVFFIVAGDGISWDVSVGLMWESGGYYWN